MADPPQPDKKSPLVSMARYSEIGFMIPAAILVGLLFGKLHDYWLHTTWLYLAGLILGIVAGFVELVRTVTSKDSR